MNKMTDQTIQLLWSDRFGRDLRIGKWFKSMLIYSGVLTCILVLFNLCFIMTTSIYTVIEKLIIGISSIISSIVFLKTLVTGFFENYALKQIGLMAFVGFLAIGLQIVGLFSLVAENLIHLQLQQQMLSIDTFVAFVWYDKAKVMFGYVTENNYLQSIFSFVGILISLLLMFPVAVMHIYHRAGRKAAFLEYLKLRKIANEKF